MLRLNSVLQHCLQDNPARVPYTSTVETLALLQEIWSHIRIIYLKERPKTNNHGSSDQVLLGPYAFACAFYGIEKKVIEAPPRASPETPIIGAFDDLTTLSKILGRMLLDGASDMARTREAFSQPLILLAKFAQQLQVTSMGELTIKWEQDDWLAMVLRCTESKVFIWSCILSYVSR